MLKCQRPKLPRQGAVKVIDGREKLNLRTNEGLRIYKLRTFHMESRQDFKCAICERLSSFSFPFQFDHQDGRGMGGKHRNDAIVDVHGNWINAALCENCNSMKGSKRYKWVNGVYRPVEKFKEKAA